MVLVLRLTYAAKYAKSSFRQIGFPPASRLGPWEWGDAYFYGLI